jgi:hypothetical protein
LQKHEQALAFLTGGGETTTTTTTTTTRVLHPLDTGNEFFVEAVVSSGSDSANDEEVGIDINGNGNYTTLNKADAIALLKREICVLKNE